MKLVHYKIQKQYGPILVRPRNNPEKRFSKVFSYNEQLIFVTCFTFYFI